MRYSERMKTWRRWLVIGFLTVAASAATTNEVRSLKIYPLDPNNTAVIEAVRELVGTDGLVTPDRANSRVLVITTAAKHQQIKQALPTLTMPVRNVRVEVRFRQAGRAQQRGLALEGRRPVLEYNVLNKGSFRVREVPTSHVSVTTDDTTQILTVASGHEASLFVGEEVPNLDYLMDYLVYWHVLNERITWEKVGSQLVVQPTIIGDGPNINIRLIPQLSGLVEGHYFTKKITELATEVEVADGQTLQIGGVGKHAEFYNHFLMGYNQDRTTQSLGIMLTPHILPSTRPRYAP